jgi:hypothetical protein
MHNTLGTLRYFKKTRGLLVKEIKNEIQGSNTKSIPFIMPLLALAKGAVKTSR